MNLDKLRIGAKLWLAVSLLMVSLPVMVALGIWHFEASTARADAALAQADRKIALSARWASLTEAAVGRLTIAAATSDPAVQAQVNQATQAAITEISKLQKELGALPRGAAESAQLARIAALRKTLLDATAKTNQRNAIDPSPAARAEGIAAIEAAARPYLQAQAEFQRLQEAQGQQVHDAFAAERHATQAVTGVLVAVLLAALATGAAWLIRSIRRPLAEAVALAGAIARGDLTRRGDASRGDEFGELMRALNRMSDALARTVGEVRNAADQIATGSGQIAIGNQDLSKRTEDQASSLQETAASMEQLGSTVRSNADAAREATALAGSAAGVAVRGGEAVQHVVQSMQAISASSRRIADIIATIDGIAFQTNLLALNAAVEAARAGEQGRGFAVVAGEVRNLSHRAAEAAREIRDLIQDSVAKVETGSLQVGEAGRTMQDIVGQVARLNELLQGISTASSEQSSGIGQVGQAVSQLDAVTQQNAALVEESAAAAASLNQQAARLVQAVGVFVLAEGQARRAIAHAAAGSRTAVLSP
jgi:methyl-accepting chemotaxis protein